MCKVRTNFASVNDVQVLKALEYTKGHNCDLFALVFDQGANIPAHVALVPTDIMLAILSDEKRLNNAFEVRADGLRTRRCRMDKLNGALRGQLGKGFDLSSPYKNYTIGKNGTRSYALEAEIAARMTEHGVYFQTFKHTGWMYNHKADIIGDLGLKVEVKGRAGRIFFS